MIHSPSPRERRKARARAELLASTRALMAQGGPLRVSDIAERSDIALGSFYSHFASKDEAVEAVVEEAVRSLADAILEAARQLDDPAEAMSVGVRMVVGLCHRDPGLAQLLINLDRAQERFEAMARPQALAVIEAGVRAGRFTTDDASLVVTVATGAVLAAIRNVLAGTHGEGADAACAVLLLRAVGLDRADAEAVAARALPAAF